MVSNCCKDQLIIENGDEGTSYYCCRACGNPCSPFDDRVQYPMNTFIEEKRNMDGKLTNMLSRETLHLLLDQALNGIHTQSCDIKTAEKMLTDAIEAYCKEKWGLVHSS